MVSEHSTTGLEVDLTLDRLFDAQAMMVGAIAMLTEHDDEEFAVQALRLCAMTERHLQAVSSHLLKEW